MTTFLSDLRYGIRQLRKTPGFTVVCVLTLALGIGANTAVFSVMNAVLLKSLPVTDPERVVYLNTSGAPHHGNNTGDWNTSFSYPVYEELRQQKNALSEVIAYVPISSGGSKVAVRVGPQPEEAEGDMVSGNFFSGLGVSVARGRGFTTQDEAQHAPIAVISYNYWTQRFSRNPDLLGKTLYVKGVPLTIVGIAAEGFEGVEPGSSTDFWIPLQSRVELNAWSTPAQDGKTYLQRPDWWCLRMLARLAPGITRERAIAQLQPIFQTAAYIGIGNPEPGEKRPVLSFQDAKNFPGYDEDYGKPLRILMAMVGLVLLIALSNVVMLLMARNTTRQREFSLRLALGAGRKELFRQLLTESMLLVALGGVLAWLFASGATRSLAAWSQIEASLAPDRTVLLFTLVILLGAALAFGLAPLRVALSGGPGLVLKTSAATSNTDAGKARVGKIIVTLQMALCLVLLVGGGLLIRTLRNLENLPLGMRTQGLVVFGINPQHVHSFADGVAFYQNLTDKLRTLPGVQSVTLMEDRIGSGWSNNDDVGKIDGKKPPNSDGDNAMARANIVGPDFFQTLGVPIVAGRDFADSDTAASPKVAIINELFAQRFLPNENPLGHHLSWRDPKDDVVIVGVVKNHKYRSIEEKPIPMQWFAYTQQKTIGEMHFEMRVHGDPMAILPAVRKVVQQIDPNLPLMQPMTQRAQYEESISQQLLFGRLAGFFALLAVVLVATGLYGTLAYYVNNRTVEIGVRMAIGAQRKQVVWMVLRDSLLMTGIGILAGVPLAIFVSRELASALYGVKPYDALSYVLAVLGVALVAAIASLIPANRAASVDPLMALRAE
ncbi:ABC transporter permease [Alloacidobacterium dinghuense]|uniref:ABC transporter permease n=1 Tax=Alloacidobacterium dinghuense TaxID=2763107 RepID=A0A7G8BCI0_9BACT|nr:ABC transporter permease [Alloacidobacterium dinghuense]QNI30250.1 ABC transporter permease [Alloacidobacterium dinghuense]